MKYSEAIKLLEENPNNVVEAHCVFRGWMFRMSVVKGISRYFHFEALYGGKVIDQSLGGGAFNGNVALDLDWKLVRQPVPWQEAIQAWVDGKVVYVENKAGGRVYRHGGEGGRMYLLQSEITTGTWYVED